MNEGGKIDWIKEMKVGADAAAKLDAQERVQTAMVASRSIIERMAQEYEFHRDLVDTLNVGVLFKLNAYVHQDERINYMTGLAEAAIEGFESAIGASVSDPDSLRIFMRDYREELYAALKL